MAVGHAIRARLDGQFEHAQRGELGEPRVIARPHLAPPRDDRLCIRELRLEERGN